MMMTATSSPETHNSGVLAKLGLIFMSSWCGKRRMWDNDADIVPFVHYFWIPKLPLLHLLKSCV